MRVKFDLPNPNRFAVDGNPSNLEVLTEDYFNAVGIIIRQPDERVQPEGFTCDQIFLPKPLARAVASAIMGAAAEL